MDYDVIIIGGGPAGLTAGLYTSRARLRTLLLESYSIPGQAIVADCIENYPGFPEGISGFELVDKFKKQVIKFGVETEVGTVDRMLGYKEGKFNAWRVEFGSKSFTTLSVIIASGGSPKKLGIKGEDKLKGRGVSYCATCDAAFFKDKDITVIGGGNTAAEEALLLSRFGKRVILIHRRDRLRAAKVLQERVFSSNKIEFIPDSRPVEILGEDKVKAVKIKNVKSGQEKEISCEGVFIFVGYTPNTNFVKGILDLDDSGYIITDDRMETSQRGIFACGDCRRRLLAQVVTACGEGAVAAYSAGQHVEELKGTTYK